MRISAGSQFASLGRQRLGVDRAMTVRRQRAVAKDHDELGRNLQYSGSVSVTQDSWTTHLKRLGNVLEDGGNSRSVAQDEVSYYASTEPIQRRKIEQMNYLCQK